MSFTTPEVFWALLLLVPAAWLLVSSYRLGRQELQRLGGVWRGHRLHSVHLLKSFFSGLLLLLTFLLLVTAWAGPSWGRAPVEEPQNGLDVALAVDVSRSMTAADVKPSRLAQAQEAVRTLLAAFPTARFSLTVFEGSGVTLAPLTSDLTEVGRWVGELGPDLTTSPGSNLADGFDTALRTLGYSAQHHRAVVLLSDGESRDGDLVAAARRASARGIEVFTLGFGTARGARIPDAGGDLKDDFGFPVVTKRQDSNLVLLSSESGGQSYDGADRSALRQLRDQLASLASPASRGGVGFEEVPRYRVLLLLALVTLTGYLLVRIVPWRGIF